MVPLLTGVRRLARVALGVEKSGSKYSSLLGRLRVGRPPFLLEPLERPRESLLTPDLLVRDLVEDPLDLLPLLLVAVCGVEGVRCPVDPPLSLYFLLKKEPLILGIFGVTHSLKTICWRSVSFVMVVATRLSSI